MMRGAKILWSVAALLSAQPTYANTALPTKTTVDSGTDRQRALTCLTLAIAYEAGWEPLEGQQAVAEVVLNRTRSAAYPKSVCGVVFAGHQRRTGCQFTFTCDGSLGRRLSAHVMARARAVAQAALDGLNPARAPGATHYHADYVSPYWAPSLSRVASIGRHIFYRPPGARDQSMQMDALTHFAEPAIGKVLSFEAAGMETRAPSGVTAQNVPGRTGRFLPWGLSVAAPPR